MRIWEDDLEMGVEVIEVETVVATEVMVTAVYVIATRMGTRIISMVLLKVMEEISTRNISTWCGI